MFWTRNKLKIHSLIGEGLNASVYKVSKYQPDLNTEHLFALKVLKRPEDIKLFKLEFENLLKASGRRLVSYRGWERYKSKPALLLDLIEGVTLFELTQFIDLDENELMWVYQEAQEGLKELEQSGLFHGDLSTKNIMINLKGEVKLIDFGLTHWSTRKIEITPEFAAPSVLNGEKPNFDSDLFSLQKIIRQFDKNASFEKSLCSETPTNLISKVNDLKSLNLAQTQALTKKTDNKTQKSLLKTLPLVWMSALVLAPISLPNHLKLTQKVNIRSANWVSVSTSPYSEGCFTPCSLNFKKNSLQKVYWRKNRKAGEVQFYTDKNSKTLFINTAETTQL